MLPMETVKAIDVKAGDRVLLPDATKPHPITRVVEGRGKQAGMLLFHSSWGTRALRRYDDVRRPLASQASGAPAHQ